MTLQLMEVLSDVCDTMIIFLAGMGFMAFLRLIYDLLPELKDYRIWKKRHKKKVKEVTGK